MSRLRDPAAPARRMAVVTGVALPNIAGHIVVRVIHVILIVGVAINTGKYCKIVGIRMTVGARVPFTLMVS